MTMSLPIQAVFQAPGSPAVIVTIEPTLENLQSLVGGLLEYVPLEFVFPSTPELFFYCHAEGKLQRLALNFAWGTSDYVMGPIVVMRSTDEGTETSLTSADVALLHHWKALRWGGDVPDGS